MVCRPKKENADSLISVGTLEMFPSYFVSVSG